MTRISYVNSRYLPHQEAAVHIEDRGFQFADGIYEVIDVRGGRLVDSEPHLARLERSLKEIRITLPMSLKALRVIIAEIISRNRLTEGLVYLQITRGSAPRNHIFPPLQTRPSIIVTGRSVRRQANRSLANNGVKVITVPETRWRRCDIKSVALLANILAKESAHANDAHEAWFVDDGAFVTEGASTNAWIVDQEGVLVTRQADTRILAGITREVILTIARRQGISVLERPFTVEEAKEAKEAFITAATTTVLPVTSIDDAIIGDGQPGPITQALRSSFLADALKRP